MESFLLSCWMAFDKALLAAEIFEAESATEFVADAGMTTVLGVLAIAWLIEIAKKLSPAVYPILAKDVAKIWAFNVMKAVDKVGILLYWIAIQATVLSEESCHWFTFTTVSEADGMTMKKLFIWLLDNPFGIIESLIEIKTVLSLLEIDDWAKLITCKLFNATTQSYPLNWYPLAHVEH